MLLRKGAAEQLHQKPYSLSPIEKYHLAIERQFDYKGGFVLHQCVSQS